MTKFKELNLNSEIMKALKELNFIEATPIQTETIPFILKSKEDLIALAQTGTGKTAAFGLPILNQIKNDQKNIQSIVLCPTRELCLQISKDLKNYSKYSKNIDIAPVYGGERIDIQIKALQRGTNIVVGTPGRVCDLIRRGNLKLNSIKWLVLDEADEMLDMGFKEDLDTILKEIPKNRQTLLFSATMSRNVSNIAKQYMHQTHEISVSEKNTGADNITHEYYIVHAKDRFEALKRILDSLPNVYGILFCRTRRETQEIADKLKQVHYNAEAIHGDVSQDMRTKIMDRFRKKQIKLLVATDVAARGIDVHNLSHIINYQLPDKNEIYTHRSGRTGRAQKSGVSISIINMREVGKIKRIEAILGKQFTRQQIPNAKDILNKQIDAFLEELQNLNIHDPENNDYQELIEKLKEVKKENLIKYIINYKFIHFIKAYQNASDLNNNSRINYKQRKSRDRSSLENNSINLKINFGKRNRFNVKELFSLINSDHNLHDIVIGKIDLHQEYSIFSVEKKMIGKIKQSLNRKNFRGRKINIEISNENNNYFSHKKNKSRPYNTKKHKKSRRNFKNKY